MRLECEFLAQLYPLPCLWVDYLPVKYRGWGRCSHGQFCFSKSETLPSEPVAFSLEDHRQFMKKGVPTESEYFLEKALLYTGKCCMQVPGNYTIIT